MARWGIRRAVYGAVVAGILSAAGVLVTAGPAAPALAATGQGAAFVLSDVASPPLGVAYTPSAAFQYNSLGDGTPVNTVTRMGTGAYVVILPNFVGFGATHAVAWGFDAAYCSSGDTVASTFARVDVDCFGPDGKPADHRFLLSFTNVVAPWQNRSLAYMEVESNGTIFTDRHFNSAGGMSTVTFSGAQYVVRVPGQGHASGNVQVNEADGTGSHCQVSSWNPAGPDLLVNVLCFLPHSTLPTQAPFILSFADQQSQLGVPVGVPGQPAAYLLADQPGTSSYSPPAQYSFSTAGAGISVARGGLGYYVVGVAGMNTGGNGSGQLSAFGTTPQYCVAQWGGYPVLFVHCFNAVGAPVDGRFSLAFIGSPQSG